MPPPPALFHPDDVKSRCGHTNPRATFAARSTCGQNPLTSRHLARQIDYRSTCVPMSTLMHKNERGREASKTSRSRTDNNCAAGRAVCPILRAHPCTRSPIGGRTERRRNGQGSHYRVEHLPATPLALSCQLVGVSVAYHKQLLVNTTFTNVKICSSRCCSHAYRPQKT